jgi:hypothetical protein
MAVDTEPVLGLLSVFRQQKAQLQHLLNEVREGRNETALLRDKPVTVFNTHPIWTALAANSGPRQEKPATNHLTYDTTTFILVDFKVEDC